MTTAVAGAAQTNEVVQSSARVEVALRAVVFASVAVMAVRERPWRYAELPDPLRVGVPGVGVPDVPAGLVLPATVVLVGCCLFAALGRRWAQVAVLPMGWLLLGLPQMYGKVNHYHHLLWLAALYAFMSARSVLRWTWPIMGIVYLFPGLAKLEAADVLVDGGMLRIVEAQQWVIGWDSPVPMTSGLASAAAVGAIVFEVGFIFAGFTRWRRGWAMAGVGFHVGVFVTMGIVFWSAAVILLVLCFDRSKPRLDWQPVAAVVLAGAAITGVMDMHGWPFAPYPKFASAPTQRTVLEVHDAGGDPVEWLGWMPNARRTGLGSHVIEDAELCEDVAPEGGSCWRVVGDITPDGVEVVETTRL